MTSDLERRLGFLLNDAGRNEGLIGIDRVLAVLGCRLALPLDAHGLSDHLQRSIDDGAAPGLLRAAFLHAVGYLGAVRISLALPVLSDVISALPKGEASVAGIAPSRAERVASGTELYDRFDPGRAAQQGKLYGAISPDYYPMAMELAGITLADPAIDGRQRQIMTIAMLSCLGGQDAQVTFHAGVALKRGVTAKQLGAILVLVQGHAGLPRANAAALLIREAVLEHTSVNAA